MPRKYLDALTLRSPKQFQQFASAAAQTLPPPVNSHQPIQTQQSEPQAQSRPQSLTSRMSSQQRHTDEILSSKMELNVPFEVLDARLFFIRNTRRKRNGPVAFEFVSVIDTDGMIVG
jgi:hypothetical protein